jgi:hypothetical protein
MAAKNTTAFASEKPTIVVIQGSFQTPLVYEALEKSVQSRGYPVVHPELPSCSNVESPSFASATLLDDALAVRSEVGRLVDESKTVVLVMHSYGGIVGNEAIPEELTYTYRRCRNLQGGVIYLFMIAASFIEEGKSVFDTIGVPDHIDIQVVSSRLPVPYSIADRYHRQTAVTP